MQIRRSVAYLGLLIGVVLLIWAGFARYPVHQSRSINGYGLVREAARDGLIRDDQGRLVRRSKETKPDKKDANTCYT